MINNQDPNAQNNMQQQIDNANLNNNPYINMQNDPAQVQQVQDANLQANAQQNAQVNPQVQNPQIPALNQGIGFDTNKFLMGLAIGAAGAYLLTNENAQKALFKTFAKGSELFTAGIEEMKERFEDAKAEMEANA